MGLEEFFLAYELPPLNGLRGVKSFRVITLNLNEEAHLLVLRPILTTP